MEYGNTIPNQESNTKFLKIAGLGFRFILAKTRFQVEKHEDESGAWQQRVITITVTTRAKSPRFQSSANEIEDLPKVCQTFCLLEQKVQQACQTCQICRFRIWGVNLTQIPSPPSLPFSELVPIKHTLICCVRLMTMSPLYPCGKPCSRGTQNETAKTLALFPSIINGIMIESPLRISIPWECSQVFNRTETSITFTP